MTRFGALLRSTHPGPSLVVTAIAVALGIATGLEAWRVVVLGLAILSGQLSVGLSNDAIDARRDRIAQRPDKPLARGAASVRSAWIAAFGCVFAALVLSALLSWWMLAAHAIALASAWSYNAWLKSTAFSVVPFIVSFGLLPSLVTLAAAQPRPAAGWAWVAGGAIGIAVHLTNVLPDLDEDAKTGVHGLPHRLGRTASAVVAAAALIAGASAVLIGPIPAAGPTPIAWTAFVLATGIAVGGMVLALVRAPGRWIFRLVMLAALMLCVALAAAGQSLVG
ncbi:UbiA family prenyltransferase [Microbacterium rhizomatis]|uniref:1,4-dihydroxy-2-naphthoate prenyltransferase n=1 Tax=Microbacterium rhizomatis TaxID=1631477 RepID=A0A5J5J4W4_9MICO|nr:UbiA family prenyltransferase [Microbacterium rhizomatis]KAA9108373.1 1,4-dihydroxy-2-naphthoate prenyltransferase [Microbacterium rhizomatis]